MTTHLTISVSVLFGYVLAQATQLATTALDPNQTFILEILRLLVPLATLIVTGIGAWLSLNSARNSKEAKAMSTVAVQQTAVTSEKTDALAVEQTVMSGRLDGKLEEMMALLEAKADLTGYQRAQDENAALKKADAAQARVEAKEDRAEGAAAEGTPKP